jgi:hypothetical protein
MGWPGHPDQIPYILAWIEVLSEKPSWLQKCIKIDIGCSKVLSPPNNHHLHIRKIKRLSYRMPHWMTIFPHCLLTPRQLAGPKPSFESATHQEQVFISAPRAETLGRGPPIWSLSPYSPITINSWRWGSFHDLCAFKTTNLYNWKQQNLSFSDKPQGLISVLETMFFTHQPTWDDCQQLLQTLSRAKE